MKISRLFVVGALIAGFTNFANASVVNFSGSNADMGTVAIGQSGTISNNASSATIGPYTFANGSDYAVLPSDAVITFTYTFSNMAGASLHSFGSYSYTANGSSYMGNSSSYSPGSTVSTGSTNGVSSAPLVFATANLSPSLSSGTETITNISSSTAQIQSMFSALFNSSGRLITVSYNVSAVPLPASLPMFASVLAALFGFSQLRKRRTL